MKKLVLISVVLLLVACNSGANQETKSETNSAPIQTQPPTETTVQTQDNATQGVWIDVRSAKEYETGHLMGAVNIAHTDIASQITSVAPNKDEPINLYCRTGRRAEAALQELQKLGYTNITNHGGYDNLVKKGLK